MNEELVAFIKMHGFSTGDGFVEVNENLAEMIKFVANEPSVGLFYVQQHTQNAAPNLINLKNNIGEKSHEMTLHTEDLEDSIIMVRSMKECGFPIADDMIGEIKKSLAIMSSRKPKRGLIRSSSAHPLGKTSSWSPSTWGRTPARQSSGYLSSVFKSARQRTNNIMWPQAEPSDASQAMDDGPSFDLNPVIPRPGSSSSLTHPDAEDMPLLTEDDNELQEQPEFSKRLPHQQFFAMYENYEEFKADREAKLEQWLRETGKEGSTEKELDQGPFSQ